MASTSAERQRRSRLHRKGDHSLCDESRCDGSTVTPELRPPLLGLRGRRLWEDLGPDNGSLSPTDRVLLEEICRAADRLDKLDALLRGDDAAWVSLALGDGGETVTVVVDKLLAESRQQQVAFKQLLSEFRQSVGAAGKSAPPSTSQSGGSFRDDLRARREARLADAAGR